jgi:hypothetical protein
LNIYSSSREDPPVLGERKGGKKGERKEEREGGRT